MPKHPIETKVAALAKDGFDQGHVDLSEYLPDDAARTPDLLGVKGQLASGVYKVTMGRTTKVHGHEVGNAMGVNTWAAFAGSDEQAIVDGDFVMWEPELQPVLKALRGAGINIVAIHHHMTEDSPRTVFLHYWGVGPTRALATGLKAALETQRP